MYLEELIEVLEEIKSQVGNMPIVVPKETPDGRILSSIVRGISLNSCQLENGQTKDILVIVDEINYLTFSNTGRTIVVEPKNK